MSDADWADTYKDYSDNVKSLLDGYSAPGVPDHIASAIPGRFTQRMQEWSETSGKLKKLEEQGLVELRDGLVIDTGLYGNSGLPITGDYDLFAIVDKSGNPVPLDVAKEVVAFLQKFPETFTLHGAHIDWPNEVPFKSDWERTAIYERIIKGHETEAVIVFGGTSGGAPVATHSRNGTLITRGADGTLLWQRQKPIPYRPGEIDSGEIHIHSIDTLAGLTAGTARTLTDDPASGGDPSPQTDTEPEMSDEEFDSWLEEESRKADDLPEVLEDAESETSDPDDFLTADQVEVDAATSTPLSAVPNWAWAAIVVIAFIVLATLLSGGGSTPPDSADPSGDAATETDPSAPSGTDGDTDTDDPTSAATDDSTTPSGSAPSNLQASGDTFGLALIALIESDPATYGLLQNYADILTVLAFGWTGSPEYAFQMFDIRRTESSVMHPDGSNSGQSSGATDVVKASGARAAMSQADVDARFNNSDFPCGEEAVATTFCPDGVTEFPAGEVVMFSMILNAEIPTAATDRSYQYLVALDDGDPANNLPISASTGYAGGTDRQYTLTYQPSSGWTMVVTDGDASITSAARWMLRGDALVLVVPAAELGTRGSFRLAAYENAGELDLANLDDWAGDSVPSVGAQLAPIIPLAPAEIIEIGTTTDTTGDVAGCAGGALVPDAAIDIIGLVHLRSGVRGLVQVHADGELTPFMENDGRVGVNIVLDFAGGSRRWEISAGQSSSRMTPDNPFLGEHPTGFVADTGVELYFDNDLPSGSTISVELVGPDGGACDTIMYTVP